MGKRRRLDADGHILTFDPASRNSFITGFTRRKKERRKWAVREILEKERQDRIEAKKDYRQDVKKKWKDLQRAERRVDALLGPEEQVQWLGDLKSSERIADELPVTVAFAVEDDDPFGGCEVTTTVGGVSDGTGQHLPLALIGKSGHVLSTLGGEAGRLRDLTGVKEEDPEEKSRRRQASASMEETRRQSCLEKSVTKKLSMKNVGPVKKSKLLKGSKGKKGRKKGPVGRKERRKRMRRAK